MDVILNLAVIVREGPMSIKKQAIDPDDEGKGSITYTPSPSDAKGLFISTYYFRDTECAECDAFKGQDSPWTKTDIYKTGLLHYLKVTESPQFAGWKLVIYTDAQSLEKPIFKNSANQARLQKHQAEWKQISEHPNTIFAVVNWPEYAVGNADNNKTIDNAILRALRMKAFHDFPDIPVFVRDADTLFENIIKVRTMYQELVDWEAEFLAQLKRIPQPYQMIIASQPNYNRQWHIHPETGVSTTGCYAAITSTLGGIDEWKNGSIWRGCLAYLRKFSKVVSNGRERKPNNIAKPTYIGKDEQLLSYVVLPAIFKKIYFYYFEYIQVEGTKIIKSDITPFADLLIAKGYKRYPSPYIDSLGEQYLDLEESAGTKRKDENVKTESTLLAPKIIGPSLDAKTQDIMQTIFQYYLTEIKNKMVNVKGISSAMQYGGGRSKKVLRKRKTNRGRKRGKRSTRYRRR